MGIQEMIDEKIARIESRVALVEKQLAQDITPEQQFRWEGKLSAYTYAIRLLNELKIESGVSA